MTTRYFSASNFEKFESEVNRAMLDGLIVEGRYMKLPGNRTFKIVKDDKSPFGVRPAMVITLGNGNIFGKHMVGKEFISTTCGFHQLFMHGQKVDFV